MNPTDEVTCTATVTDGTDSISDVVANVSTDESVDTTSHLLCSAVVSMLMEKYLSLPMNGVILMEIFIRNKVLFDPESIQFICVDDVTCKITATDINEHL